MTINTVGYHAIIEHAGAISSMNIAELDNLLRQAASAANATILSSDFHDFGNGLGNTGVLLLAESHISIHTWPEKNYAAIDIFVCSDRESVERAVTVLRQADEGGTFHCQIIERVIKDNAISVMNAVSTVAENLSKT